MNMNPTPEALLAEAIIARRGIPCPTCGIRVERRGDLEFHTCEEVKVMGGCPCECNSGGFCGGCGHAGCGGRRGRR